jgi:hypothetical protein
MNRKGFLISATVDFGDDCRHFPITEALLEQIFDRMQQIGVRRMYWNYTQPSYWRVTAAKRSSIHQTLENLGDPMAAGCRLAHQRGMDFYAIIKPFESGSSHAAPSHSPENVGQPGLPAIGGVCTRIDPWVMARPELRVRARAGDLPAGLENIPVTRIQLRQRDTAPVRLGTDNLQIWTSQDNYGYQRKDVSFTVTEVVEACPHDVVDILGEPVTRQGEPVRVLNLAGLNLTEPFIAITTDIDDDTGTFRNTAIEMIRAFGPEEQPLPIVVASHKAVYNTPRDFRTGNLEYDCGHGDINVCLDVTNSRPVCVHCREKGRTDCMQNPIYSDTPICRDGVIAFARGRNAYVSGSLCEAYAEVQDYWMHWVGDCLLAGVDGIDWRVSNHSCWTNTPLLYGFNQPVLEEYQRRYGVNPELERYDPQLLGDLRGDFYDQFLWKVKRRLAAAGKRMHMHLELESFRPDAALARRRTRPGNITFHWKRWLHDGLADEATLMAVNWTPERVLNDPVVQEMLREANAASVPTHLRHFIWLSRDGTVHADRLEYAYRFGGLSGYNLYETASFYDTQALGPDGTLQFYPGLTEGLGQRIRQLNLA